MGGIYEDNSAGERIGYNHIFRQSGGPDGELSASMRYLAQRYTMPYKECKATLTDIGTEELAHLEMICAIVYQLTKNMTMEQLKESGFDTYYVDHTSALWPTAAAGIPHNACEYQSKGDIITDLFEDMAADAAMVDEQLVIGYDRTDCFFNNKISFAEHTRVMQLVCICA